MTTCKRYDLFQITVNSLLKCIDCINIDKWIVVDDNSSQEDRTLMKEKYPFIEFIFKTEEQKGHPISMNIIYDLIQGYTYWVYMKDDFYFFDQKPYVETAKKILMDNVVQQVLFNRNYAEDCTERQLKIVGSECLISKQ